MKDFFTAFSCENSSLFVEHCPNLCLSDLSLFRNSSLDRTPKLTDHFGSGNIRKLILSTFQVSGVPMKNDLFHFVSQQVSLCYRLTPARYIASWSSSMSGSLREVSSKVCCQ